MHKMENEKNECEKDEQRNKHSKMYTHAAMWSIYTKNKMNNNVDFN